MFTRQLGRSGITVSALGFGCWPNVVKRQVAELNEHLVRIGNKIAHYRELYQRPLAWHTQATAVQISH